MMAAKRSTMGRSLAYFVSIFMLFGIQICVAVQDFSQPGPYSIGSVAQKVTISPTGGSKSSVDLDVIVTYPTSGAAPFPVVAMFNGFQAKAPWYSATANHVASWGYVVVQYTVPGLVTIVTDKAELGYLQPLLNWVTAQGSAASGSGPLKGLPDTSRLATLGHSRGGKLAALHYAGRSDVATAVLIDPVDNSNFTPESQDYPSAVKALAAANRTAGLIGAGITSSCNPAGSNYRKFFDALAPGTWQMVVLQAGHMQFARTGNKVLDWGLDQLCRTGKVSAKDVIADTDTFAVAWLESTFRAKQSQAGLADFQQWIKKQSDAGAISFAIKGSSSATVAQ